MESDIEKPKSFGILGIRERIKKFDGTFNIIGDPGKGTIVYLSIPVNRTFRNNQKIS